MLFALSRVFCVASSNLCVSLILLFLAHGILGEEGLCGSSRSSGPCR